MKIDGLEVSVHVCMTSMVTDYDRWKLSTTEYHLHCSVKQYLLGKKSNNGIILASKQQN